MDELVMVRQQDGTVLCNGLWCDFEPVEDPVGHARDEHGVAEDDIVWVTSDG